MRWSSDLSTEESGNLALDNGAKQDREPPRAKEDGVRFAAITPWNAMNTPRRTHLCLHARGLPTCFNASSSALELDRRQVLCALEPRDHASQLGARSCARRDAGCGARAISWIPRSPIPSHAGARPLRRSQPRLGGAKDRRPPRPRTARGWASNLSPLFPFTKQRSETHFTRTGMPWDYEVTHTTALGRQTKYAVERNDAGAQVRTNTFGDGSVSTTTKEANDSILTQLPDGTTLSATLGADPRFGMMKPYVTKLIVTLPSGLTSTTATDRTAVLANPNNPLSVVGITEVVTVNGNQMNSHYDGTTRTWLSMSSEGRTSEVVVDARGRLETVRVPKLEDKTLTYDALGRPDAITQGTRWLAFGYHPTSGFLSTVTDALSQQVIYQRDAVGRTTQLTRTDAQVIGLGYDPSGNLTHVTPASQPAHQFEHTPVDLVSRYTPPSAADTGLGFTSASYDLDRALSAILLPDATTIGYVHDAIGRLQTVQLPGGSTRTFLYDPVSRELMGISGPYAVNLAFTRDGGLATSETISGAVNGSVAWTYDQHLRVTHEQVNAGADVAFGYDHDGQLTSAGALTLVYDDENGMLLGTVAGTVTDAITYNGWAETDTYAASFGATPLFEQTHIRDLLGRITQTTETVDGETHVYEYTYDLAGRLTDVHRDAVSVEHYAYDPNGNRALATNDAGTESNIVVDAQDRLTTYGDTSFVYSPSGELQRIQAPVGTTVLHYDAEAALLGVDLADGRSVEYQVDGAGRRVGKKADGLFRWALVYQGSLRPAAELDAAGAVVSRFVYAERINVPAYVERGGALYRILTDEVGSVRLVVNASTGDVVQRMDYDAWGRVLRDEVAVGWLPIPFGFAGGLYDRDTGWVQLGAREYMPEVGRWTLKEPLGFAGSDNFYAYAEGDPVNLVDPTGLAVQGPSRSQLTLLATFLGVGGTANLINEHHNALDAAARGDVGALDCAPGRILAATGEAVAGLALMAVTRGAGRIGASRTALRGSYWRSPFGNKKFPTKLTTMYQRRGKWLSEGLSEVRQRQRLWFDAMRGRGLTRNNVEGRILEAGGSPNYPFYRKLLDTLYGPKG